jgi:hypothetical protein
MHFPLAMSCTDDFSRFLIDYNLRLQGMPFFLATIELLLFFLGRSIGLSVTSMTTVLMRAFD